MQILSNTLTFKTPVMNTEQPIKIKTTVPVTRCSTTPRNLRTNTKINKVHPTGRQGMGGGGGTRIVQIELYFGFSPGADDSDSIFRLST
jgi:hypothetical protein